MKILEIPAQRKFVLAKFRAHIGKFVSV